MTESVLIIGATSDIGRAIAAAFARHGHPLVLAARSAQVEADAQDLRLRYEVPVSCTLLDILDSEAIGAFAGGLDPLPAVAVCVVGLLGDQAESAADAAAADTVLRSNFNGPAAVLGALANRFEERGTRVLIGVSSVAADRGRASNYVYGSAKAGLTAFLSGLRNRLAVCGVRVITVKPGFVDTRMTEGMRLPPALTAQPAEVAEAIYRAFRNGRGDVLYVRPVWRLIMMVIRSIPEPIFKRLKL